MRSLDNYFKYLKSSKIIKDFNLIKEYPRYDELVGKYEEEYKKSLVYPVVLSEISKGQVYAIPYDLLGGDKFELKISIDKLYNLINSSDNNSIIKENEDYKNDFVLRSINSDKDICKINFDSRFLNSILSKENIDKNYALKLYDNNEEIICGDFYGITSEKNPFVILDGNHRCYSKIMKGKKKVDGILVSRNVWINCLLTEADRMFIKIFSNTNLILTYRAGFVDFEYVNNRLYKI